MKKKPTFTIIAGVNGSGKTTFALDYFKNSKQIFINADLIASGLSPNNPDLSQFSAGKLMLKGIKKHIENNLSFAVETTLSSKNYLKIIKELKQNNWNIELIYLYLPNVDLSIKRVAERVKSGGHNIKTIDIKRRYGRSISNLMNDYFNEVDEISCMDNSLDLEVVFVKNNKELSINNQKIYHSLLECKNVK